MKNKTIFEKELHIDPRYAHLDKYVTIMYKSFWTPAKYEKMIREVDAPHFFSSMTKEEQELIRRCILAIALVEDKVKLFWSTLPLDIPQTVVGDVGGVFAQSETTHRRSYSALADALGVDTNNLDTYDALRDRIKYLNKHTETDSKIIGKKRILKKLTLFTVLVEKISLFSQFYLLMSFEKSMKGLKTISALQNSTASEETVHYNFGLDVINIIKEESPQLWDEYLVELISKSISEAHKAELKLIDWFFENGEPSHVSKKEVINFLNKNFNGVCSDLGLDISYEVDDKMYLEKNEWFDIKLKSLEPDFFDNLVPGYAKEKEDINIENFEF